MKNFAILYFLILFCPFNAVSQTFPFVIQNNSGGSLAIKTSGGSTFEYCPNGGKLVAYSLNSGKYGVNTPSATAGSNYFNVQGGSSNMTPNCNDYYVEIANLASGKQLNIRPSAGSTAYITDKSTGTKRPYGNNGDLFAVKSVSSKIGGVYWYEIYLTDRWNQNTGWVSGDYAKYSISEPKALEPTVLSNPLNIGNNSCDINWSSVSSATNYDIYLNSSHWTNKTGTSTSLTGLSGNSNYSCYLICRNANNCTSGNSNTKSFTTIGSGSSPQTPTGFTASTVSNSSIELSWNLSSGATSYDVYTCSGTFVSNVSTNNFTVTGLMSNTFYEYKVLAKNSIGSSKFSSCMGTTTNSSSNLSVPLGFTATSSSSSSIQLSWNSVIGATSYEIQTCSGTFISSTNFNNFSVTGLNPNTVYSYKVRAKNSSTSSSFTTCQSTTTSQSSNYGNISGEIKDASIKPLSNEIQLLNFPNCEIKLFEQNTNTLVKKMMSASDGSYNFTNLSNSFYDLEASFTLNGTLYIIRKNKITPSTSNLLFKFPKSIINQIKQLNDNLSDQFCSIEDLSDYVLIKPYNVSASENLFSSQITLINSEDELWVESCARLYLAEYFLYQNLLQAETINGEAVKTNISSLKAIASLYNIVECSKSSVIETLAESMTDGIIDMLLSSLSDLPNDTRNSTELLLTTLNNSLKNQATNGSGLDINTLIDWFELPLAKSFSEKYLGSYIEKTQLNINYSANNSKSNLFSNTYNAQFILLNDAFFKSNVKTAEAQAKAQSYRESIEGPIHDLIQKAIDCGVSKYKITFIINLTAYLAAHSYDFIEIGLSLHQSNKRFKQLITETNQNLPLAYNKRESNFNLKPFNSSLLNSYHTSTINSIADFEKELTSTILDIVPDYSTKYSEHMNALILLNRKVEESLKQEFNVIKVGKFYCNINNVDSLFIKNVYGGYFSSMIHRIGVIGYLSLLNDSSSNLEVKDSILKYYNKILSSNKLLSESLLNFGLLFDNTFVPAFIIIDKTNLPLKVIPNNELDIFVNFTNYGSTLAENAYIKLIADSNFFFSTDSIYIGDLEPGKSGSVSFVLSTPSDINVSGTYKINFGGKNTDFMSQGGAIVSDLQILSNSNIKSRNHLINSEIYPNPNNGIFKIELSTKNYFGIRVFNILGKEVYENKYFHSGDEIVMDNISSGIYFIEINTNGIRKISKLIIEK